MNLTVQELYYALNTSINQFLKAEGEAARLYAFGINPNQQKKFANAGPMAYFQSSMGANIERQFHTQKNGGILTRFDYHVNFYAAKDVEQKNAEGILRVYNKVIENISDIKTLLFRDLASIDNVTGPVDLSQYGGNFRLHFSTVYRLTAVCRYSLAIAPDTPSTVQDAIDVTDAAIAASFQED